MPIIQFLKFPSLWQDWDVNIYSKLSKTIFYRLATLSFTLMISIFLNYIMKQNGISETQNMLYSFFNQNSRLYLLLSVVFFWPMFEEFIFRSLLRPKLRIIYLRFIWFIYLISKKYIYNLFLSQHILWFFDLSNYLARSDYSLYIYLWVILFILCIIWLFYLIAKYRQFIYDFVFHYFTIFFRLSCLIFGLVHITNFSEFVAPRYIYILMVIPQFTIAIFLWFVRIRLGLWYSMFYHILHNWFLSFGILYAKYSWVDLAKIWPDIGIQNPTLVIVLFLWILSMMTFFILWIINIVKIIKQRD